MLINIKKIKYCLVPLMIVSCSTANFDSQGDYGSASPRNSSNLAVPPGLTAPDMSSNYKMLDTKQDGYVLNQVKDMKIVQSGSERWLKINNRSVDEVWPMMQAFINQQGLNVKFQNKNVGLIQTDWATRDTTVHEDGARGFFDWVGWGSMYSLGSQYMYRVTMWQNESDTLVFVTDYQMNEVYPGCVTNLNENIRIQPSDAQATKWIPVTPDPALELGFLMQFMAFTGMTPSEAKQAGAVVVAAAKESSADAAYLVGTTLVINDDFDRTWWRTSVALERAGLGVNGKNRTLGEYYVYPLQSEANNPDPGFMDNLFGDDKNQPKVPSAKYTVKLQANGNKTNLVINLYQGVSDSDFAKHQNMYLEALQKQLK